MVFQSVILILSSPNSLAISNTHSHKYSPNCHDLFWLTDPFPRAVLNCVRVLTRLLPYIFEDSDWSGFFWTSARPSGEEDGTEPLPLAQTLMVALCDLLFCPDFTVTPSKAGAGVVRGTVGRAAVFRVVT